MSAFSDSLSRVPTLAAQHLLLAFAALALGLLIGLPLGLWSARRRGVERAALGFASLVQTVPSLALLALFYPVLLWLSSMLGGHIPALGFLPALIALTLYSLLPIVRNVVTGLQGVDPAVREAADGVGMTGRQKLLWVEAPLALPTATAGVRTAAVWTIGAATLSTTVGQSSLGDLIFAGLQTQDWGEVLAGCLAAAALALGVDALLGLAEAGLRRRRRAPVAVAGALLAAALGAALFPLVASAGGGRPVVIGAKNFSEQFILARLIGQRLERAGYRVEYRDGLGSAVAFSALKGGAVDMYVDYAGTLWTGPMRRTDSPPHGAQDAAVARWAATQGVRVAGALGFENAYAFATREPGLRTLADLTAAAPRLSLGTDLEFLDRPEWRAVRSAYHLSFASQTPYSPTFMYRALESGRADVITAFSSDGRIAADRLAVLADPRHAIPGYDALLLVGPGHAKDTRLLAALRPLVGRLPVEAIRGANLLVDRDSDKRSPEAAARWLAARVGLR